MEQKDMWDKLPVIMQFIFAIIAAIVTIIFTFSYSDDSSKNIAEQLAIQKELYDSLKDSQENILEYKQSLESILDERIKKFESLKEFSLDDETLKKLSKSLLIDQNFKSELVKVVSEIQTSGLVLENDYKEDKEVSNQIISEINVKITKLLAVYNAIDIRNKENILSIPLIRKDISNLIDEIKNIKQSVDKSILTLQAEIASETNRIYDLGKWFMGLLLAALIIPLIEPITKNWFKKKETNI